MGHFNVTRWRCDRCGIIKDERPEDGKSSYRVNVTDPDGYSTFAFNEVCRQCKLDIAYWVTLGAPKKQSERA